MKRIIVLLAVIIIALIAAIPVMAQGDPESAYPIETPEPTPTPTLQPTPISIGTPPPDDTPRVSSNSELLIIIWFQKMVKWVTSIFK